MELVNTRSKEIRPLRACIFGNIGNGKSTLAASAPSPIFINLEDRLSEIDTTAMPVPTDYDMFYNQLIEVYKEEHNFKTLAIDTVDSLESLVYAKVCKVNGVKNISDIGFGGGYEQALNYFRKFIDALNKIREVKEMAIILLAHAHVKTINDPLGPDYDKYEIKLREKNAAIIKERMDLVGFLHTRTYKDTVTKGFGGEKTKASGGQERILSCYTSAAFDSKNSYNITDDIEIPIVNGYQSIIDAIKAGRESLNNIKNDDSSKNDK